MPSSAFRDSVSAFSWMTTVGRFSPVLLTALLIGCGQGGDTTERRIVTGQVTYDNQPIPYGMIRFIPTPDGPVTSAMISEGKFVCKHHGGVPVGPVRIEVEALPNTSSMSEDELLAKGPPKITPLPEKYNQQSKLTETIPSGRDEFPLDLKLEK